MASEITDARPVSWEVAIRAFPVDLPDRQELRPSTKTSSPKAVRIHPALYQTAPAGLRRGLPRSLSQFLKGPNVPGYNDQAVALQIRYARIAPIPPVNARGMPVAPSSPLLKLSSW